MHHSLIKASPHSINLTLCLCLCRHHNYLSFNGSLSGGLCLSLANREIHITRLYLLRARVGSGTLGYLRGV